LLLFNNIADLTSLRIVEDAFYSFADSCSSCCHNSRLGTNINYDARINLNNSNPGGYPAW
jgi:hypothetical protein